MPLIGPGMRGGKLGVTLRYCQEGGTYRPHVRPWAVFHKTILAKTKGADKSSRIDLTDAGPNEFGGVSSAGFRCLTNPAGCCAIIFSDTAPNPLSSAPEFATAIAVLPARHRQYPDSQEHLADDPSYKEDQWTFRNWMPTLIANPGKKLISVGFFAAVQKSQCIDDVSITKRSFVDRFYRELAWTWLIIIGGLMITPGGIECIACGFVFTKILGVISVVIGITGFVPDRIQTLVGR